MSAGGLKLAELTIQAIANSIELNSNSYQHDQRTDQYWADKILDSRISKFRSKMDNDFHP